ncbi:hypothetical protein FRC03_001589 [Tulasnella sp. 419]|nr:hypothetical protein FRC03_001589 [Tulasnella sp. 419]
MASKALFLIYVLIGFFSFRVSAQNSGPPLSVVSRTPTSLPKKSNNGVMIGALIGSVALFFLFVAVGFYLALRRARSQKALVEQIEHNKQEARKSRLLLDPERQKGMETSGSPLVATKAFETARTDSLSSETRTISSHQPDDSQALTIRGSHKD